MNNNHGSAIYAGFGGILEKDDLKFDIVFISVNDHQSAILARFGGEIWKDRFSVDNVFPLTIHKKSGRFTGSDKDGLIGKDNCQFNSVWKTDNTSLQPSGCRKRKRKTCIICEKSVIDLRKYMRRKYRLMASVKYFPNRKRKPVVILTRKYPRWQFLFLILTEFR
jgi:hypothetical protein